MTEINGVLYNKDELVPPKFLDEQFVLRIIKGAEKGDDVKLIEHHIIPGSKAGDHYASVMFKIIATYSCRGSVVEKRSFVLKTIPDLEGTKKELLEKSPIFKNEIKMYAKVLVEMEKILKMSGEKAWWPKMVFHCFDTPVIVFDDLGKENYQMVYDPLGFDDLQLIVEKIAKYHAMSVIMFEEEIIRPEDFNNPFENDDFDNVFKNFISGIDDMSRVVQTWPGFEEMGQKLREAKERLYDNFRKSYATKPSRFNVLNHGDFHIRNMMFKKDAKNKLSNVMFLDFQIPVHSTPAIDLSGLMVMIGNQECRDRRFEVYRRYYDEFEKSLKRYGYRSKPPTLLELQTELLRNGVIESFQTLCFLPVFCLDFTKVDMDSMFDKETDNFNKTMNLAYSTPQFVDLMKALLPRLYYLGYLD